MENERKILKNESGVRIIFYITQYIYLASLFYFKIYYWARRECAFYYRTAEKDSANVNMTLTLV